jgi:hypothetical protein
MTILHAQPAEPSRAGSKTDPDKRLQRERPDLRRAVRDPEQPASAILGANPSRALIEGTDEAEGEAVGEVDRAVSGSLERACP